MKTRRLQIAFISAAVAAMPVIARAQSCGPSSARGACADQKLHMGSAAVGYGMTSITGLGAVPDRAMSGVNLHYDLHLLSLVLHSLPIRTYDAFYIDVTYGRMTSAPLKDNIGPEDSN